ncbi:MAG: hypothetical protein COA79_00080 [Planctomycetota bacterium]|nr:MAG: hypothetical protein COA79_00080 [Planctomycetota bacterium]
MPQPKSLYIHIPYCRNICDYCSFPVFKGNIVPDTYIEALKSEWEMILKDHQFNPELETIYFGGGTPSLLNENQLEELITYFTKWKNNNSIEITLEANPTSLLKSKIHFWKSLKINRISLGIQSLSDNTLKTLTRTHSSKLSKNSIQLLKESEFPSFNLDVIFGVPGQSVKQFEEDLKYILDQNPTHISAYELTIEEGTPYAINNIKQGPEDDVIAMTEILDKLTPQYGILKYEISNYAKPGFESKHNINYWLNNSYFGLGSGAFSFINRTRSSNERNPQEYIQLIEQNKLANVFEETLSDENYARETLMTQLRTVKGINCSEFKTQTDYNPIDLIKGETELFIENNLMTISEGNIKLTATGLKVANSILKNFI